MPTGSRGRHRAGAAAAGVARALDELGARAIAWALARLPERLAEPVEDAAHRAAAVLRAATARFGPVRARVWLPAAAVAVALVAAIVLVPAGGTEAGPRDGPVAADADPAGSRAVGGAPGRTEPGPLPGAEDPEDAAVALIAERAACLATLAAACLDGVVQPGSPAEAADLAAIAAADARRPPEGADWRPATAALVDLLGAAALVDVVVETAAGSGSAPVLLVRTGAGWRIRAVLAGAAGPDDGTTS